jgi:hypothetical protein
MTRRRRIDALGTTSLPRHSSSVYLLLRGMTQLLLPLLNACQQAQVRAALAPHLNLDQLTLARTLIRWLMHHLSPETSICPCCTQPNDACACILCSRCWHINPYEMLVEERRCTCCLLPYNPTHGCFIL